MTVGQPGNENHVHTIDLEFRGIHGAIAAYLIPHEKGALLVESGPGSTIPTLLTGLQNQGFAVKAITDVLVTHIHLDHAGATGWLARQGAQIHVHPKGATHLTNPEKLLSSAARIYGDEMQTLWGEFLPVPEDRLRIPKDGEVIEINGLEIKPLDTPGHAHHHFAYIIRGVCFTGDIGGVRIAGTRFLRLPMPPPEFHPELWRESIRRLRNEFSRGSFSHIALTHFGIFDDPGWHLAALEQALDEAEEWTQRVMPSNAPIEELKAKFMAWEKERTGRSGLDQSQIEAFDAANASWMSAYGIYRYWHKVRNTS